MTYTQTHFRSDFISGFEQKQSLLRDCVTTEAVVKGNQATFLVADSGSATAVTRGVNGLIPGRSDNLNQTTVNLEEWHDKVERSNFDIFSGQSDGRRIMMETTYGVVNRKIDEQILNALAAGTQDATGSAVTANLSLVMKAKTILGNNSVPWDGNIHAIISPAFEAELMQNVPEFASRDYIDAKPFENGGVAFKDKPMMYNWMGVNWIVHPNIDGVGTNAEKCFMFHKSAIGHAFDTEQLKTAVGYNDEHDYSFARCSFYGNAKMLQNGGIVVMTHDGSGYAAS